MVADAPGPEVLDQLKGWKRIYANDIAVIHVRVTTDGRGAEVRPRLRACIRQGETSASKCEADLALSTPVPANSGFRVLASSSIVEALPRLI